MIAGRSASALLAAAFVACVNLASVSAAETTPAPPPPPPAQAQAPSLARNVPPLGISNEYVSVKFGLLLQPQYQILGDNSFTGQGQDLYVRRARIIVGGTLFNVVDYFFDTD